jgi:hypothetical protein
VHTPRFCGQASIAGTLFRATCGLRGLRISWFIVGIVITSSNAMAAPRHSCAGAVNDLYLLVLMRPLTGTRSHWRKKGCV